MERKPKSTTYIEPMPQKEFFALMREFKKRGGKYMSNDESERYLEAKGVEACTLNATTILFRKKPSRAAVREELYHAQQYRDGKIDGTIKNACVCEIEAQHYLLDNAMEFQLTEQEIHQTKQALNLYTKKLLEMKGDVEDENM